MREKKKIGILALLITLVLSSCNFNSQYINRVEDKKVAEEITDQFYNYIKNENFDATLNLFGDKFWEVTTEDQMLKIFTLTKEKLGLLNEINLDQWETRRVEGTNPSASYLFVFKNQYSNYEATETIRLMKDENGEIKIVAYNINSMGFRE